MIRIRETRLTLAASAAAIALQLMLVNGAFGQTTTWVATSGGNWNATSSWNNGIPNSATATAIFPTQAGVAYSVSIFKGESFTVGTLNLVGDVGGGPILNFTSGTLKFDGAATINAETHPAAGSGINVGLVFLQNGTINTVFPDSLLNISSPSFTGSPGVSLTKTGPGTLEFGSDAGILLTGALNVNEGTLTIFNALDVGTTGGAKDRVAALEIANATVNVAGGLTITSGGVLALGAGFGINGPLVNGGFVPNATLTADGGTIRTLAALTIPNNVTLAQGRVILDSNGFNSTFSGTFTGSGGLTKINAGTVILTGDNSYSGDTAIQEGTLVAGTPNAAQKISTALGTGNVFLGGGTLRTTSATTGKALQINVGGAYTQDPGGTLALGIGGLLLGQYDHLFAQGNATVHGTLEVSSLNGFRPSAGDAFAVVLTKGTRTGLFDHLNDFFNNNPNITARLQPVEVYAPNGVALVYVAAAPGPSPNPIPPIIDVIPTPLPPVALEKPLPPSFVVAALNPTIEQLTSMFEIPFSGANTQRFNLDNRLAEIQRGSTGFVSTVPTVPPPEIKAIVPEGKSVVEKQSPVFQPTRQNRWGVWVNGWGDWASVDDDASIKGYNFTTGGGSVGIDYRITDCLAVGLFGTYAHTWTSLSPGDVDVDTGRGGLYATYWNQGFYVNSGVYGGYNSYDTSRQTLLRGRFASGSTEGYEFSTFLEAGYDFRFGNFTVGPIGAVQYTNVHIDGYTERGSFLPLQIHDDSEESWRTDLGLQASYTWHVGNVVVIPIVQALWEHEYKYSALPITFGTAIFPGATATVFGPDEGDDSFIINAGAGVQWTPRISTFVGYQGQLGRTNYSANGVTGSISFSF